MAHYLYIMARCLIVLMVGILVLFQAPRRGFAGQCQPGNPQCWKNNPFVGHGPAHSLSCSSCFPSTGDGTDRRVISIRIDPSWNIPGSSPPQTNHAI